MTKEETTWYEKYGKNPKRMKYMRKYMRAYRKKLSTANKLANRKQSSKLN